MEETPKNPNLEQVLEEMSPIIREQSEKAKELDRAELAVMSLKREMAELENKLKQLGEQEKIARGLK